MGSPISGTISEIFLQHFETHIIKHFMEIKSVIVYKRYVDDILISYDQEKINHQQIIQTANSIHSNLSSKHELEDNGNIVFFDLTLHRNETNITIDIERKPTTSTVIHSNSNHPQEHKEAAFPSYSIDYVIYRSQNNRNKRNGQISFT